MASDSLDDQIQALDSSIAKSPPLPSAILAWRLFDSLLLHTHRGRVAGAELVDRGFVDLTLDDAVAHRYVRGKHPVVASVVVPEGTRVAPLFQITGSDEGDVLLGRGTRFRIVSIGPLESKGVLRAQLAVMP